MTHQNCVPVRHLFTINHIESLEEKTIVHREAVRAIIRNKDKVLLIRSRKFGEYKFPGGGIDVGESMLDALRREVKEETGYDMNPAILSFGRTIEFHPDFAKEFEVFLQTSDYFMCSIFGRPSSTEYAEYEIEIGYYP
ncbi:MAG: NUDIX hydrolase, partial [Candidatus Izemoplasmatales bacterium]